MYPLRVQIGANTSPGHGEGCPYPQYHLVLLLTDSGKRSLKMSIFDLKGDWGAFPCINYGEFPWRELDLWPHGSYLRGVRASVSPHGPFVSVLHLGKGGQASPTHQSLIPSTGTPYPGPQAKCHMGHSGAVIPGSTPHQMTNGCNAPTRAV